MNNNEIQNNQGNEILNQTEQLQASQAVSAEVQSEPSGEKSGAKKWTRGKIAALCAAAVVIVGVCGVGIYFGFANAKSKPQIPGKIESFDKRGGDMKGKFAPSGDNNNGKRPDFSKNGEQPELPKDGERPELPKDGERPELPKDGKRPEFPANGEKSEQNAPKSSGDDNSQQNNSEQTTAQ